MAVETLAFFGGEVSTTSVADEQCDICLCLRCRVVVVVLETLTSLLEVVDCESDGERERGEEGGLDICVTAVDFASLSRRCVGAFVRCAATRLERLGEYGFHSSSRPPCRGAGGVRTLLVTGGGVTSRMLLRATTVVLTTE
jgi:hypothetical protein